MPTCEITCTDIVAILATEICGHPISDGDMTIAHDELAGLADDDHSQYPLLLGRSGGQVLKGGTAATDALSLQGTAGNGTLTSAAVKFLVGNNGDNQSLTMFNNGKILAGAAVPIVGAYLEIYRSDWSISASFGDPTDGQSDNVYIVGNTINGLYGYDNDNCSIWLNYRGYHGGATKFRDLYIGDGKEMPVVFVQGSTRRTMIGRGGTPAHTLHVKEDGNCGIGVASNDTDGKPYISFYQTTTQRAYVQYNDQGVNPDYLEIQSDGHIYFNPTNNVGIGVASPDHPLHLVGAGYLTGGVYIGANSTDNLIDDASNGAGSTVLYIGNKAIATTSDIGDLAGVYVDVSGDTMTGTLNLDDDNISVVWGGGQDASISYNGTNMLINPKVVGSGYVNIQGQTLLDDKLMFTQTDGNEYIDSLADGYLDIAATTEIRLTCAATRVTGDLYVGNNAAVDPAIVFDGDTNDGQLTYMEDEDYFAFSSRLNIAGVPIYANNAAALAGGLIAGDLYRTGADPDPLCIVH